MDDKERATRDLAEVLTSSDDTDVTPEDVEKWHRWDVEEWIEAFGFKWDDEIGRWVNYSG